MIHPKSSHNFAKVLMKNGKTDSVDAETLAKYADRMDFVAWTRPSDEKIALRSFARRVDTLTRQKTAAKNQFHALTTSQETPKGALHDVKRSMAQREKRIARLSEEVRLLIGKHADLERGFQWLTGIKGCPNPRALESGKSIHKQARLAKASLLRLTSTELLCS